MKQLEQPLYPKLSPIYNKILQLVMAIILLVMLMNFWVTSRDAQQEHIQAHAHKIATLYLAQAATSVAPYMQQSNAQLQQFVDALAQQSLVKSVHVYSVTGESIASSADAESVKDLFGISLYKKQQTKALLSVVQEIHTEQLQGYIRLSLYRSLLADDLAKNSQQQYEINRLLFLVAGVIGFLLTRGLNRFSRQGYRPPLSAARVRGSQSP
ncbi:AhpA/YtjB family protein [Colwellia chukchiensis]|nr:AhpA/YtjB family protein [Colwellia chukchiensis]